ncbi:CAP domain-containing protein [Pontibacter chinhatensis]|uniref:Uncharacterized conserved protein YkwD, contains CAP (CSP/antigen 5/PR1) domain n=1 Tax=Pontibacter chinhatensis TaxID=1436961 RepID=A0A1I2QJ45_9BACT|nr:CAP domain-containing protein [Pontibacter chinhatensis]SFG27990.1 Uncharacterized conserved protein YkwD, contains CAP (CSP/antigen 5/PR1) domain [Pontibacter chinhatensis]
MYKTTFLTIFLFISMNAMPGFKFPGVTSVDAPPLPLSHHRRIPVSWAAEGELYHTDKEKVLKLVNGLRGSGCYCGDSHQESARPLTWNSKLEKAARLHSMDMYRNNYYSHVSRDGTPFYVRIRRQSYNYWSCAENIGLGYESEEAVMEGWRDSAGHCVNIMNPAYTDIAVARAGNYWVMVLAEPE